MIVTLIVELLGLLKMAEENTKKTHRDEETQGLEKVSDYVEEVDAAPELGQVRTKHHQNDSYYKLGDCIFGVVMCANTCL